MALTKLQVEHAKPRAKPHKMFDGRGLYLEVSPSGARGWRFKYRIGDGARTITIERTPGPGSNFTPNGTQRVTSFDERVTTSMGIGTQIDGLGHLGVDHHYYNGIEGKDLAGSYKLDIASIPPIATRGVLIDMTKHYNKPMLEVGDNYGKVEIEAAAKAQGIKIRKGDVVLFHTNWISIIHPVT
jgi:hypothetical protein